MENDLKNILSEKRYTHSLGVMKEAKLLAKIYGIDEETARLTGLAHDIAKEMTKEEQLKYIKENNIQIDEIEMRNAKLLHGKIGAHITGKKYGFTQEMQDAIKYHTTAKKNMNMLEKIIYVADKIEENRTYEGIEELRELAKKDIDKCIIKLLDNAIKSNINKEVLIHPDSVIARNALIIEKNY